MKIGIVVDGDTEFAAIRCIYSQLQEATGHQFIGPTKAGMQPLAPTPVIAAQCAKEVMQHQARGASLVVVLLDREGRSECPGELAGLIEAEVVSAGIEGCSVIVKDRTFENWVIADIGAVEACTKFAVSKATARAVRPDKADNTDALELLKRSCQGRDYNKIKDGKAVFERASVSEIARQSRSFRRFLRVIGWPEYCDQSRRPLRPRRQR